MYIYFVAYHQTAKTGSSAPFPKCSTNKYLSKNVYFITWQKMRAFSKITSVSP